MLCLPSIKTVDDELPYWFFASQVYSPKSPSSNVYICKFSTNSISLLLYNVGTNFHTFASSNISVCPFLHTAISCGYAFIIQSMDVSLPRSWLILVILVETDGGTAKYVSVEIIMVLNIQHLLNMSHGMNEKWQHGQNMLCAL